MQKEFLGNSVIISIYTLKNFIQQNFQLTILNVNVSTLFWHLQIYDIFIKIFKFLPRICNLTVINGRPYERFYTALYIYSDV